MAEVLVPSVGVNENGLGEAFRLNLELGRFMKSYEVDVGGDNTLSTGGSGSNSTTLQGAVHTGAINICAIAEESHGLLAFGTSLGTIEFWDSRSRSRISTLQTSSGTDIIDGREEITALEFHSSGLSLAAGSSAGLIRLYDLRSPVPLLKKDQGYGFPIHTLMYLESSSASAQSSALSSDGPKILSADKRIIKLWSPHQAGKPWTYVEPAVDINSVAWCKDSGMLLTANEGRQQHSFFIPQLGPAPKWCSFLDNLVEEMAEDASDPSAYTPNTAAGAIAAGEVYDNYRFLTPAQLETLNLSHLIGTTSLLRPYMHGYFVAQRLYEEAKLIADPFIFEEQRNQRIREKIEKERESRIRGNAGKGKDVKAKVNKNLARKLAEKEEAQAERQRKHLQDGNAHDGSGGPPSTTIIGGGPQNTSEKANNLLADPRFSRLFSDEDFAIDEASREYQALNPNKKKTLDNDDDVGNHRYDATTDRRLTAVEQERLDGASHELSSSSNDDDKDDSDDPGKISTASYKKSGHRSQKQRQQAPKLKVTSSSTSSTRRPHQDQRKINNSKDRSFGDRISKQRSTQDIPSNGKFRPTTIARGEKEISFIPERSMKKTDMEGDDGNKPRMRAQKKDRRSASGNVFRGL